MARRLLFDGALVELGQIPLEKSGFTVKVVISAAWKTSTDIKICIGAAWKQVTAMKVVISGAWKDLI